MALLASCEFEHPEPTIYPDPVFEQSGLTKFGTNSIYEDYTTEVSVTRASGLSQEVTLDLSVDATLLEEYNELYSTTYTLLEDEYYTFPATVTLPAK